MIKFLFLFVFIFILKWFFTDNNFWDVTLFLGKKGCGKTSMCAKLAQKYSKKYTVYSTVELPNTLKFNPKELKEFTPVPNSVLLIDEVSLIWDNRNWKAFDSGFTEWFRYSRQYKCKVFLFTQTWDIDLKIKGLVDNLIMLTRIGKITLLRPVNKALGIATDSSGNGQLVDAFKYASVFSWSFIFLPRYYGFFKSYNPPDRAYVRGAYVGYNELSLLYSDSKKWLIYTLKCFFGNAKRLTFALVAKAATKFKLPLPKHWKS